MLSVLISGGSVVDEFLFNGPPITCWGSVLVCVLVCITLCPFYFCNLDAEVRSGCFASIVFRMSCYCKCSVVLLHGAVGWSAVYDCGIA